MALNGQQLPLPPPSSSLAHATLYAGIAFGLLNAPIRAGVAIIMDATITAERVSFLNRDLSDLTGSMRP